MANTDQIVIDSDSATFVSEGLEPNTFYDVHFRTTDTSTGAFRQGSEHGYAANSSGALTVTLPFSFILPQQPVAAELHVWVHTLPVLGWDDEGNPLPGYDHNFGHVLDKGDGNLAEAHAEIDVPF